MTNLPTKQKLTLTETRFTVEQLLTVLQRTPKGHIYTRPAKGGGQWDYVTGAYVKKVLNYVFGWMWSFEIKSTEEKYGQIVATGRLTIHDKDGHPLLWKEDAGRADIKLKKGTQIPLDYGNDLKAATTDCLKRCAFQFGIASDIYGKNEFKEIKREMIEDLPKPEPKPETRQEAEPSQDVTSLRKNLK